MSLESMRFATASAAPGTPQPPAGPAPAGAGRADANLPAGADTRPADGAGAAAAPGPSAQNTPASQPARPEAARSAGRHSAADPGRAASKAARAAGAGPGPRGEPVSPSGSFSQALAQSQAASGRGVRHGATRGHGLHPDGAAGQTPAKEGKPDPVGTALALVSQASPVGGAAGGGAGAGKAAQSAAASASTSAAARGAEHTAQALLARAAVQDLRASGPAAAPTAASPATTSISSAAAALGGAQAGLAARSATPVHAAASPAARLSAPVGTDGWTEELGARLTWMTHQGVQSATLQLSPEHLGPLQVSISVQHGEASVWFGAAHPDTRQALEQAMPQLRQMLSGQGLTLTDSGVSRDPPREQAPRKASEPPAGAGAEASSAALSGPSRAPLGMVDAYA